MKYAEMDQGVTLNAGENLNIHYWKAAHVQQVHGQRITIIYMWRKYPI